ncbi:uncharacterized protein LOC113312033 [Papaver somniferum]|uniref:uncharacterized protein LOC113312033 n=1 Tax=Papaver somniferum TaxID=3469 RepID=UPI000E70330B|nr:uncharacterized protein LOC113312033 [Papaver somniferum]
MEFYKYTWDIIKYDLMLVVKEFETMACSGVVFLHNFRPINQLNWKCLNSKLLAEIIKLVMHSIISDFQGPFVHGRQIQDEILIAPEPIVAKLRSNKTGVIYKVDFEKAFDNVNWNGVDITLAKFGFRMLWRSWNK